MKVVWSDAQTPGLLKLSKCERMYVTCLTNFEHVRFNSIPQGVCTYMYMYMYVAKSSHLAGGGGRRRERARNGEMEVYDCQKNSLKHLQVSAIVHAIHNNIMYNIIFMYM